MTPRVTPWQMLIGGTRLAALLLLGLATVAIVRTIGATLPDDTDEAGA